MSEKYISKDYLHDKLSAYKLEVLDAHKYARAEGVGACIAIVFDAPTIETISTNCVNVDKVIEEAWEIWKANDGDTAMQTLIDWLKEYAPRVIAVPIKHGHWEFIGGYGYQYRCSECINCAEWKTEFCPHCGAIMDEVEE